MTWPVITVWLLIAVSNGNKGEGVLTVVDKFPTLKDCEFVQENLPLKRDLATRCIQANVYRGL